MLGGVQKAIDTYHMIEQGDRVVAGISGGADSVTLLLQLAEYRSRRDYTLQVFHLNHMIRREAAGDEEFVRELCRRLDVPCVCQKADVTLLAADWHMSVEEAGRKIRYDRMRALGADRIAVGHHRDDLAETVLINMCRGSGLHGMVGIAPVQDDVIRPLIYLSREEIEEYLKGEGQDYRNDITNESTEYTRNRIRHDILPALRSGVNERAIEHIASMAGDMYDIERYIEKETDRLCELCVTQKYPDRVVLSLDTLNGLDGYMEREVLLRTIEQLTPGRKDITRAHIEQIAYICRSEGEKSLDLPYGLKAVRSYDRLEIEHRGTDEGIREKLYIKVPALTQGESRTVGLEGGVSVTMRVMSAVGRKEYPKGTYTKWFDYDKIDWTKLCIRSREPGDFLTINKELSHKSIQDYMTDEKIERSRRDEVLLLADGSHILWVIGHRISEFYKLEENSKRILEVDITYN